MCLNDEENWSTRAKFAWVDGKRTKVGDIPVPLFQLKSMAQTRAGAKAFRMVVGWVVVLAGYKPTPAEEMTGDEHNGKEAPPRPQPKPEAAETPATEPDQSGKATVFGGIKMNAKFDGVCPHCHGEVKKGSPIVYDGKIKKGYHDQCVN